MSIELGQLTEILTGHRMYLTVGSLPHEVARHFGCHPGVVFLRREEANHIFGGHKDITIYDVLQMSLAVAKGRYHLDPKRPRCMTVIYYNPETGRPFQLALKCIDQCEVWVSTFHHTNEKKIAQRVGRWKVIREHAAK